MEKEPKPFSEEKAERIMEAEGLKERSQVEQDAFEAGREKGAEEKGKDIIKKEEENNKIIEAVRNSILNLQEKERSHDNFTNMVRVKTRQGKVIIGEITVSSLKSKTLNVGVGNRRVYKEIEIGLEDLRSVEIINRVMYDMKNEIEVFDGAYFDGFHSGHLPPTQD